MAPDVIAPDVIAPDAFAPDVMPPDVIAPDVMPPDAFAPDAIAPEVFTPEAMAPDVPALALPGAVEPAADDALEVPATGVLVDPQALAVRASTARPAMTPERLNAVRLVTTRTSSSLGTMGTLRSVTPEGDGMALHRDRIGELLQNVTRRTGRGNAQQYLDCATRCVSRNLSSVPWRERPD